MGIVAVVVGALMVLTVLADLINTLIATRSVRGRMWLTRVLYNQAWWLIRRIGHLVGEGPREGIYAIFAPVSVLALLVVWVLQQVIGFGLIWWGLGGVSGAESLGDSMYYSGVVYFTLGFGEIVPADAVPRFGALVEAFSGVLTTALVIGYLPALYTAYSEREQMLLTLDDGSEERMTPTNLVLSRCHNGDPGAMDSFFERWEAWVAHLLETHTTFPMLVLFRSQHPGQNWVTALGLVTDAAIHIELTEGCDGRSHYWMFRRSVRLFQGLTEGVDLSEYRERLGAAYEDGSQFDALYDSIAAQGFPMKPRHEALARTRELRSMFDAQLEYLIDFLETPRGFWGHQIGHQLPRQLQTQPNLTDPI